MTNTPYIAELAPKSIHSGFCLRQRARPTCLQSPQKAGGLMTCPPGCRVWASRSSRRDEEWTDDGRLRGDRRRHVSCAPGSPAPQARARRQVSSTATFTADSLPRLVSKFRGGEGWQAEQSRSALRHGDEVGMEYRDKLVLAPMVRVVTPLDPSPSHESVGWIYLADSPLVHMTLDLS